MPPARRGRGRWRSSPRRRRASAGATSTARSPRAWPDSRRWRRRPTGTGCRCAVMSPASRIARSRAQSSHRWSLTWQNACWRSAAARSASATPSATARLIRWRGCCRRCSMSQAPSGSPGISTTPAGGRSTISRWRSTTDSGSFDAACGGLGGCPFAPGSAGNVATERVVARVAALGFETGIEASLLAAAAGFARGLRSAR